LKAASWPPFVSNAVEYFDPTGRALNINEARPKADRSGAGGGDGFRRKRW